MSLNPLITHVNPQQSLYAAFGSGANVSQLTVSSIIVAPPNGSPDSGFIIFENAAPSTSGGVVFYKDAANQEPVVLGAVPGLGVIGVQNAMSSVFETLAVGELQIFGPAGSTFSNAVRLIGDPAGFLTISSSVYTHLLEADAVSTSVLDIDGQALTATATELLLNGIPLATTSNLSSVADWALDPAISTVYMLNNNIQDVGSVIGDQALLSSITAYQYVTVNDNNTNASLSISPYTNPTSQLGLQAQTAQGFLSVVEQQSSMRMFFQQDALFLGQIELSKRGIEFRDAYAGDVDMVLSSQTLYIPGSIQTGSLIANDISTNTLTVQSTIHVLSTVSSLVEEAQLGVFSTLFAGNISTQSLYVSSINGAEFTSTSINVNVIGVSSLVANSISSLGAVLQEALVSTLQFNPSFNPNLDVNLGLGSLFGNLAGAATGVLGVVVGGAALGTGIAALTQTRQTNNINSNTFELVNGTTQLQISTLGESFSTIYRFVSSVAENVPGQEIFISTIHGPGVAIRSVSDPLNTVSSPNSTIQSFGQWVALDANLPIPSTISSFQQLYTSSFATSTINFNNGTQFRVGVPFGGTGFVSTTELYWSDASPPLDADLRVGALVISGSDISGLNYSKDVLIQNQNNGNRLTVFPGNSTIAYLSDIPAVQPQISTFNQLFTSSLQTNTVNGGVPYTTANPQPIPPAVVISSYTQLYTSSLATSTVNGGVPYTTANPQPTISTFPLAYIGSQAGNNAKISSIYFPDTVNPEFWLDGGTGQCFFQMINTSTIDCDQIVNNYGPNVIINQSATANKGLQAQQLTNVSSINGSAIGNVINKNVYYLVNANTSTISSFGGAGGKPFAWGSFVSPFTTTSNTYWTIGLNAQFLQTDPGAGIDPQTFGLQSADDIGFTSSLTSVGASAYASGQGANITTGINLLFNGYGGNLNAGATKYWRLSGTSGGSHTISTLNGANVKFFGMIRQI